MNRLAATLDALVRELAEIPVALVGGLAVSVRTEPRFTRDVDLAVSVASDVEAERLLLRLGGRGFTAFALVEQDAVGRLATARLRRNEEGERGVVADLLFASSGIEPEIARDATRLEVLEGVHVPVARTGHLVALKLLARDDRTRPQDAVDLIALRRVLDPDEERCAKGAVALIEARGYARGRDLGELLAAFLAPD